jgi:hypothetical protein
MGERLPNRSSHDGCLMFDWPSYPSSVYHADILYRFLMSVSLTVAAAAGSMMHDRDDG